MSTPTTGKARRQRTFTITFTIGGTAYHVYPLDCDPSIGTRAVRFCKQGGDGEVYDLHLNGFGWQCQCRGFERHGYCKHVRTVQAAARIFCPALAKPAHRSTGDLALNDPDAYAALDGENPAGEVPMDVPTSDEIDQMAHHFGQDGA
jgi:hypothetical protein